MPFYCRSIVSAYFALYSPAVIPTARRKPLQKAEASEKPQENAVCVTLYFPAASISLAALIRTLLRYSFGETDIRSVKIRYK